MRLRPSSFRESAAWQPSLCGSKSARRRGSSDSAIRLPSSFAPRPRQSPTVSDCGTASASWSLSLHDSRNLPTPRWQPLECRLQHRLIAGRNPYADDRRTGQVQPTDHQQKLAYTSNKTEHTIRIVHPTLEFHLADNLDGLIQAILRARRRLSRRWLAGTRRATERWAEAELPAATHPGRPVRQ